MTRTLEILYRRNSTRLQNGMFYHHGRMIVQVDP